MSQYTKYFKPRNIEQFLNKLEKGYSKGLNFSATNITYCYFDVSTINSKIFNDGKRYVIDNDLGSLFANYISENIHKYTANEFNVFEDFINIFYQMASDFTEDIMIHVIENQGWIGGGRVSVPKGYSTFEEYVTLLVAGWAKVGIEFFLTYKTFLIAYIKDGGVINDTLAKNIYLVLNKEL